MLPSITEVNVISFIHKDVRTCVRARVYVLLMVRSPIQWSWIPACLLSSPVRVPLNGFENLTKETYLSISRQTGNDKHVISKAKVCHRRVQKSKVHFRNRLFLGQNHQYHVSQRLVESTEYSFLNFRVRTDFEPKTSPVNSLRQRPFVLLAVIYQKPNISTSPVHLPFSSVADICIREPPVGRLHALERKVKINEALKNGKAAAKIGRSKGKITLIDRQKGNENKTGYRRRYLVNWV